MTEEETGGEEPSRTSEFEAALGELERIVARLDREELSLDEALEMFETGRLPPAHGQPPPGRRPRRGGGADRECIGELATVDFDLPAGEAADGDGGD